MRWDLLMRDCSNGFPDERLEATYKLWHDSTMEPALAQNHRRCGEFRLRTFWKRGSVST